MDNPPEFAGKLVAVYGTLRPQSAQNFFLTGAEHLGVDKINASLFDLGRFPGIKDLDNTEDTVIVDVYRLPNNEENATEIVFGLDRYEGCVRGDDSSSFYICKETTLLERKEKAMVYVFNSPVNPRWKINSGDWISYRHG